MLQRQDGKFKKKKSEFEYIRIMVQCKSLENGSVKLKSKDCISTAALYIRSCVTILDVQQLIKLSQ